MKLFLLFPIAFLLLLHNEVRGDTEVPKNDTEVPKNDTEVPKNDTEVWGPTIYDILIEKSNTTDQGMSEFLKFITKSVTTNVVSSLNTISLVAFVPTNLALANFSPFGSKLRDKILTYEWKEHADDIAANFFIPTQWRNAPLLTELDGQTRFTWWRETEITVNATEMTVQSKVDRNVMDVIEADLIGRQWTTLLARMNIVNGLVFPTYFNNNVIQYLARDPQERFTSILMIIERCDLTEYLQGFGKDDEGFVLFAPVNEIVNNSSYYNPFQKYNISDYACDTLLNHIVEGQPVYPKSKLRKSMAGNFIHVGKLITEGSVGTPIKVNTTEVTTTDINYTCVGSLTTSTGVIIEPKDDMVQVNFTQEGQTAEIVTFSNDGSFDSTTVRLAKYSNFVDWLGVVVNPDYGVKVNNGLVFPIDGILQLPKKKGTKGGYKMKKSKAKEPKA